MNEKAYLDIATAIVRKQMGVIGAQTALRKARKISSLQITDDGTVIYLGEDPLAVLNGLVLEYEQLSGEAAVHLCQQAAEPIIKTCFDLPLPEKLKQKTAQTSP